MNVNKLFPRLSIRTKLAIGLMLAGLVPLVVVSVVGTRETVRQIELTARRGLEHDLQLAEAKATRALGTAEGHVRFLADDTFAPFVRSPRRGDDSAHLARRVADFLALDPSLARVSLLAASGSTMFSAVREGAAQTVRVGASTAPDDAGVRYAAAALTMEPGEQLLLPNELPAIGGGSRPAAAVAIVTPMHDARGALVGVAVGEAYASVLFPQIEEGAPGLSGITGLVDDDGLFLYHSVRTLELAGRLPAWRRPSVRDDFPANVTRVLLSGRTGTLVASAAHIVSFRPMVASTSHAPLTLYRAVPLASLALPVDRFLRLVVGVGVVLLVVVAGASLLAADQFTRPLYRVREAAWRLARGERDVAVSADTNDELEDLANDFTAVAAIISEHRQQRETLIAERTRALEKTHAELSDVLAHSADAIIGLDAAGVVRVWNGGAESLFGYGAGEATGRPVDGLIGLNGAEREGELIQRELRRHGAIVNLRAERRAKDGTVLPVSITQTLMTDGGGQPLGSSLIVRDVRVQARLEEHMRRSERLAATSVMAAGLAHEINNPLAIIANRVELMQHDVRGQVDVPRLAKDLSVLHEHVIRLSGITAHLLRFARSEPDEIGEVSLAEVTIRAAGLLERTFASRELHLVVEADDDQPPITACGPAVETVLVNLLLNAADATPRGGSVTVTAGAAPNGEAQQLKVRDTGPGVPPELHARIFEPFFTSKSAGHGTGLGLAVCRAIVERHGGTIREIGCPGEGARFVVTLPLEPSETPWTALAFS